MNVYEYLIAAALVIVLVLMITQYFDAATPKLSDVLAVLHILPCYEVKVYRNGKRLRRSEWMEYLTSPVRYSELKDSILYITID